MSLLLDAEIRSKPKCFHSTSIWCEALGWAKVIKNIPPSTVNLTYEIINNNHTNTHRSLYDYCVTDEVSLAKLFMKPFMAQLSTFDCSFDSSAAFAVPMYIHD